MVSILNNFARSAVSKMQLEDLAERNTQIGYAQSIAVISGIAFTALGLCLAGYLTSLGWILTATTWATIGATGAILSHDVYRLGENAKEEMDKLVRNVVSPAETISVTVLAFFTARNPHEVRKANEYLIPAQYFKGTVLLGRITSGSEVDQQVCEYHRELEAQIQSARVA